MNQPVAKWKKVQALGEDRGLTAAFTEVLFWRAPKKAETTVFTKMLRGGEGVQWDVSVAAELQGAYMLEIEDSAENSSQVHRQVDRELQQKFPHRILRFKGEKLDFWYWPKKLSSGSVTFERVDVKAGLIPDFLAQRLAGLGFEADQVRAGVTPLQVRNKIRGNVESSKITKAFYEKFKLEHEKLSGAIIGLPTDLAPGYSTLLLNRLMFIYFLQKKEFLNRDSQYLQNCLSQIQGLNTSDTFFSFYRDYLLELFFSKLDRKNGVARDARIEKILGQVPYVNGGIFGATDVENEYEIQIPDSAFESIFSFFSSFTWHLDTRPTGTQNEINPEVIGYIFEQYINFTAGGKKENGAYYTQADVTGYMVAQTLPARVMDDLTDLDLDPIGVLCQNPHRYLNESMSHGAATTSDSFSWLPVDSDLEAVWNSDPSGWQRLDLSIPDPELALPGETLVEMFHRRDRVDALLARMSIRDFSGTNDLITANLNIQLLISDVIELVDESSVVAEIWNRISSLSIIDPTCGSGAFLFSALESLEDIYGHLADRAEILQGESKAILDLIDAHPNRRYFLRKHAAMQNLYGTDLMPDAIETAKLRIFLALASCLEKLEEIEPLPDLDFNFKVGNLVFGFSDTHDALRISKGDVLSMAALQILQPKIEEFQSLYTSFQRDQGNDQANSKQEMLRLNKEITGACNQLLMEIFGVDPSHSERWIEENKPFHWFAEFPEVMGEGGFDVVIGNPPYISKKDFPKNLLFQVRGYENENFSDFYVPCLERVLSLVKPTSRLGLIVMSNYAFGQKTRIIRKMISDGRSTWNSTYGRIPDGLFTPARVRNSIIIAGPGEKHFTTQHQIFTKLSRSSIFGVLEYASLSTFGDGGLIRGGVAQKIAEAIGAARPVGGAPSSSSLALRPTGGYWFPVLDFVPPLISKESEVLDLRDGRVLQIKLTEHEQVENVLMGLAGKLGYLWWSAYGDDFDCRPSEAAQIRYFLGRIGNFPSETCKKAYQTFDQNRDLLLMASLNAGAGQVNIKWGDARLITDFSDKAILEAAGLGLEWRNLNIWYRQVMKSSGPSSKAFAVKPGSYGNWQAAGE